MKARSILGLGTHDNQNPSNSRPETIPLLQLQGENNVDHSSDDVLTEMSGKNEPKSSFFQAAINVMNLLAGIGILSLPYAFKRSGWVVGVVMMLYMYGITNYSAILIGRCMREMKVIRNYGDLGRFAFGNSAWIAVSFILSVEMLFGLAMYITVMADHLFKVFPQMSRNTWVLISTGIVYPTCLTNKLHLLSYLSLLGFIGTVYLLFVLVDNGFMLDESSPKGGSFFNIQFQNIQPIGTFTGIIYSIGLQMMGFAGHTVFPRYQQITILLTMRFNFIIAMLRAQYLRFIRR